jgi:hypothetical protein
MWDFLNDQNHCHMKHKILLLSIISIACSMQSSAADLGTDGIPKEIVLSNILTKLTVVT